LTDKTKLQMRLMLKLIAVLLKTFSNFHLLPRKIFSSYRNISQTASITVFFISPEFYDFILFSVYYLNVEIVMCFVIFIILFNKEFFLKQGLSELLTFVQVVLFAHLV